MILGIFLCVGSRRNSPEELINIRLISRLPGVTEPSRRQGLSTPAQPTLLLPIERHQCRLNNMVLMIFIHSSIVEVFTKFVMVVFAMIHICGEWPIHCQVLSATEVADGKGHRGWTKCRGTDSLVMVAVHLFNVEVRLRYGFGGMCRLERLEFFLEKQTFHLYSLFCISLYLIEKFDARVRICNYTIS